VYDVVRVIDNLGDDAGTPAARLAALSAFGADLATFWSTGRPSDPVLVALVPSVRAVDLQHRDFAALVDANVQDQKVTRYGTYGQLRGYCALSAAPIGRLVLSVFGAATPARIALSDQVCDALQWRLVLDTESIAADEVVLAVPPPAAEAFRPGGGTHARAGWSERLGASPIVNVHVRYDRRVTEHAFFATVGSPVQWAFDRTEGSGAGVGQYLAVSLSAAGRQIDERSADVQAEVLPALTGLLPAARDAKVLDSWVTRERTATFRAVPGTAALRPPARTAVPGVVLAGAYTATGWPATVEGAVRSGHSAAQALLPSTGTAAAAGIPVERGTG